MPNGHLGLELTQQFLCQAPATHIIQQYADIAGFPKWTQESADRESYYLITCIGHTLHFHASLGANKEDFCLWAELANGIGNRQGREDMTSRTSAADDDFKRCRHNTYEILRKNTNNSLVLNILSLIFLL